MAQIIKLPVQRLDAAFAASEANREERTVPMTWYAGATVLQFNWENGLHNLKLSMEPKAVRLKQLNSGRAPFLNSHNSFALGSILGNIQKGSVALDGEKGTAVVRFSKRSDVEPIFQDIADGVIANVSVGAKIHRLKEITQEGDKLKTFVALDWEPYEVSAVAVGADPGAHFAATGEAEATECEVEFHDLFAVTEEVRASSPEEQPMEKPIDNAGEQARTQEASNQAMLAERKRVLDITALGAKHGLAELAAKHVGEGTAFDAFKDAVLSAIAAREEQAPTRSHAAILRDEGETRKAAFIEALQHRAGMINLTDKQPGYQYRGLASQGLIALASECVRSHGKNPAHMSPMDIAQFAMGTSDFPLILAGTADASLRAGYALAPNRWREIFSRRTAPNFKNQTDLHVGMSAGFPQVPESGEFKHGSITEGSITWKLLTYGQIISLTRQTIVNDNLGALTNIPQQLGVKAGLRQNALAWAVITANASATFPGDSTATALFEASTHLNYTSSGTAISVDSLGVARKTLKAQTDLGGDKIEMGERFYLVVPVTKEQLARQYTSSAFMPTAQSSVNPWVGSFDVIASSELDASSTTAWYVFPNPVAIAPVLIYGFLDGQEGIASEVRQGFDIDGTEWKARFDFGVGAIDYRGAYKNAGA